MTKTLIDFSLMQQSDLERNLFCANEAVRKLTESYDAFKAQGNTDQAKYYASLLEEAHRLNDSFYKEFENRMNSGFFASCGNS